MANGIHLSDQRNHSPNSHEPGPQNHLLPKHAKTLHPLVVFAIFRNYLFRQSLKNIWNIRSCIFWFRCCPLFLDRCKDIQQLHDLWSRYHDDLTCPQYDEKPTFLPEDRWEKVSKMDGLGIFLTHMYVCVYVL